MNCQNQRNVIVELRQNPAEMGVPSVAMNDVRIHTDCVEVSTTPNRSEHGVQILRTTENCRIDTESSDSQMRLVNFLVSKAAYLDIHNLCQPAAQVIDVNTCTPIDIGGILVRQKECFHPASKNSRIQEFKKSRSSGGESLLLPRNRILTRIDCERRRNYFCAGLLQLLTPD